MRPTNLPIFNSYSENMAYATMKRSFECDSFQNYSEGTAKRRRCPVKVCSSPDILKYSVKHSLPYEKVALKLTSQQIVDSTREESKKRRRNYQLCSDAKDMSSSPAASYSSEMGVVTPNCKDKPIFTYNQVFFICENVIMEIENQIRNEYDRILNTKLAEQYEGYVKFAYDEIQKRYENRTPSYLS